MLGNVESLAALRAHVEELRHGMSQRELEDWKLVALQLINAAGGVINGPVPVEMAGQARLSPRENEVMRMMLNGRRLKEIAAELGISVKTVTTHRARLLRKLKLTDNLGLYRYGIRTGLVSV